MVGNKLTEEQINAYRLIRAKTTFLWKKMEHLANSSIENIECEIRVSTYREIKAPLNILKKAGYIAVHLKGNIRGFFLRKSVMSVKIRILDKDNYCKCVNAAQNRS